MRFLISSLVLCLALSASAQKVKLIYATSQSWSGGVAGHHGTNYNIRIQCNDTNMVPDTLWIAGNYYPVNIAKGDTVAIIHDRKHNTITYNLYAGDSWNDLAYGNNPDDLVGQNSDSKNKKPVKSYDGAALVTYQYKGIQQSFLVKAFRYLEPLNYP
jgi:hypothetical protein